MDTPGKPGRGGSDAAEALARLARAAEGETTLRRRLVSLLEAPAVQRRALLQSAATEMAQQGEPAEVRTAFLLLGTDANARAVLELLRGN